MRLTIAAVASAAMVGSLLGCPSPRPGGEPAASSRASPPSSSAPGPAPSHSAAVEDAGIAEVSADAGPVDAAAPEPPEPRISADRAQTLLFVDKPPPGAAACRASGSDGDQIRCMLALLYEDDKHALTAATALYDEMGIVAGVEVPHMMDGGWRGMLELVPEPPVGRHRRHLQWLLLAYRDFNRFFAALRERGSRRLGYRYKPIALRFFRSVGRTTPSAYASDWTVAYNVSGSLHRNADAVRETMFHETFHLNDRVHGHWSANELTELYDAIVVKCMRNGRLSTPCLRPYAPNRTMVRGGTYYAFQPGNGVWEYAAELAIRYYREQRAALAGKRYGEPAFKCGPPPNAAAWQLLVDEFFAGVDLVPACP